jgi:hypothetical protein
MATTATLSTKEERQPVTLVNCQYHYDNKHHRFAFHDGENTMLCNISPERRFLLLVLIAGCSPATGLISTYPTNELRHEKINTLRPEEEFWIYDLPYMVN